ncbi:MAG: formylglycine-generating enzyme family protein [Ignavibacteriales bacterium]|nr:formylglycine-generating enzyme family protein [Ignavibacteriales bacterium]
MKTHLIVLLLLISCTLIYPQTKNLKPEMIKVEGGTFTMGSNDGERDEKPVHQVTVGSFDIGKTEVTRELWESVMDNTSSNYIGDIKPVASVNWLSVVEFCNKLSEKEGLKKAYSISGSSVTCDFNANGYRLPTEAEWEYAASGGKQSKGYKYSGGNDIGSVAWYFDNSGGDPQNVATKLPNELGLYDMSGNVWEWCWDWYGDYTSSSQTNPEGASGGTDRVFRGGSYDDYAKSCRVAKRLSGNPIRDSRTVGLRVVRTIDSPQPQTQEGPKPELIEVEGGTFTMGSNDGENNEKPSIRLLSAVFHRKDRSDPGTMEECYE